MKCLEFGKIWIFFTVLFLSMVCFAPQAFSYDLAVGDHIKLEDGPGNTNGGEFELFKYGATDPLFNTFCLEKNEYFSYGQELVIYAISDGARNGGVDGQEGADPNFDPLDPRTAYLYYHFIRRDWTLYDYNDGPGRISSANLLQNAIWFFEQEITDPGTNLFVELAETAVSSGAWSGLGLVRVLNLVDTSGKPMQDQLYLPSPEPATMLLLGTGLLGLAGLGRRKMLKKKG